jgi:hypothetical protein
LLDVIYLEVYFLVGCINYLCHYGVRRREKAFNRIVRLFKRRMLLKVLLIHLTIK